MPGIVSTTLFGIIDPFSEMFTRVRFRSPLQAQASVGLEEQVRLTAISRDEQARTSVMLATDKRGKYALYPNMYYFAIDRNIYAGRAILYVFSKRNDVLDLSHEHCPRIMWLGDSTGVQLAIEAGHVNPASMPPLSATGRIVDDAPNLQSIPVRTEEGDVIRQAAHKRASRNYKSPFR